MSSATDDAIIAPLPPAYPGVPASTGSLPSEDEIPAPSPALRLDTEAARRGSPLRILFVAAEGVPFVKVGGLADVIGSLPKALRRLGHDVRVVLPFYGSIDPARWGLRPLRDHLSVPIENDHERVGVRVGDLATAGDLGAAGAHLTDADGGDSDGPDAESAPLGMGDSAAIPVYFIDAPRYFHRENVYGYPDDGERFILFSRAALELVRLLGWAPDIIHCHDWHTAIIPNWLASVYRDDPLLRETASAFTIHNLAFQGIFGYRILEVAGVAEQGFLYPAVPELANVVDLMGRGILFADVVSTVSPRYAREILTPQYGERLDPLLRERRDRLFGILNGIDVEESDPATDAHIAAHYDAFSLERRPDNKRALQEQLHLRVDPAAPLIGMVSRLSDQKGFDLLDQVIIPLIEQGVQLAVTGVGDQHYHQMFQRLAARYPQQVAIHLTFSTEVSQRVYAGADMFLMPSRFEPCGISQMLAMRYGSIPIVHRTGGLADTVQEMDPAAGTGNGFSFERYDPFHLFAAVMRAIEAYRFPEAWKNLMVRAMLADYSWDASAEQYVALYRRAGELRQIGRGRETATASPVGE
ncbi:MAG TPA: glycogen/starch synthase [Ktedonobacterales bacterium]|jgi:starch synthase